MTNGSEGTAVSNEIATRHDGGHIERYTPPTPDQVVELLQLAAAYDRRTFGYAEKVAWMSAGEIGQWTYQEAAAAIKHHQATSTAYLTPGHITEWIKDQRRKARLTGGTSLVTGMKFPSHQDAVNLWAREMQRAGANPTDAQLRQASSILAQMLDGAVDPTPVLSAAVLAAQEFSARVDRRLERMAKDGISPTAMPPIPVEYIPDDRLNVHLAVHHPDFPAEWREWDFLEGTAEARQDQKAWEAQRLRVIRQWYGEHPEVYGNGYVTKPKGWWDN